jgi:hypothetical protein
LTSRASSRSNPLSPRRSQQSPRLDHADVQCIELCPQFCPNLFKICRVSRQSGEVSAGCQADRRGAAASVMWYCSASMGAYRLFCNTTFVAEKASCNEPASVPSKLDITALHLLGNGPVYIGGGVGFRRLQRSRGCRSWRCRRRWTMLAHLLVRHRWAMLAHLLVTSAPAAIRSVERVVPQS